MLVKRIAFKCKIILKALSDVTKKHHKFSLPIKKYKQIQNVKLCLHCTR